MKNSALPSPLFIFFGYGLPNLARLDMFPNDILSDRREQSILTKISQILQCPIESPWHSFPPFEGLFIQDQQKRKKEKRSLNLCSRTDTLTRLKPNLFALYALELSFDLMRNQRICEMDELDAKLLSNAKSPHSQSWWRQGISRWNEIIVGEEISRFQMQSLPELIIHYNYWWFFHSRWICAWSCPVLYPTTACSRAWSKVRPFAPPAIDLGPTVVNAHSFDAPL